MTMKICIFDPLNTIPASLYDASYCPVPFIVPPRKVDWTGQTCNAIFLVCFAIFFSVAAGCRAKLGLIDNRPVQLESLTAPVVPSNVRSTPSLSFARDTSVSSSSRSLPLSFSVRSSLTFTPSPKYPTSPAVSDNGFQVCKLEQCSVSFSEAHRAARLFDCCTIPDKKTRVMGITDKFKATARHFFSSSVPSHSKVVPSDCYNILVLGETQAGKSTFIQTTCQYACPMHQLTSGAVGDGFNSCTSDVVCHSIITNLPSFKVVDTKLRLEPHGAPALVDYVDVLSKGSLVSYDKILNQYQTPDGDFELKQDEASKQQIRFNLYDTPGLNDSNCNDELHVANIFNAVKKAGKIHMVLIVVGQGPCSPGLQGAIRSYLDIFPQFQDIMAIVHTKTDYKLLHPKDPTGFDENRKAKTKKLHEIIGRDNFPHFWIDCDLHCIKPVPKCITQNTLQMILRIAMSNQPLSLETATMSKTPRMRDVDKLIEDKYGDLFKSLGDALHHRGEVQGKLMSEVFKAIDAVAKNESDQENAEAFIKANETDETELMDEFLYTDEWAHFHIIRSDTVSLKKQDFTIDVMNVYHPGFKLDNEEGGEGATTWSARYKRKSYKNGVLRVRCYVKKRNKYKDLIEGNRSKLDDLKRCHEDMVKSRESQAEASKEIQGEVDELVLKNTLYTQIVKIVREDMMRPDLYRALANAGAYRGTPADNVQKVVEVLTDFLNRPDVNAPFRDRGDVAVRTIEAAPLPDPVNDEETEMPGAFSAQEQEDDILFF